MLYDLYLLSKWLSPIPRGALGKKNCEGALREELLQVGLPSFLQRVLPPNETPFPTKRPSEGHPKMSQNAPKMGSLGGSWGPLWPTWVPKRRSERQVGAKMGPVGAKMSDEEV